MKQTDDIVKARACGQYFKFKRRRDDLHSLMPAVEGLRMLLVLAAVRGHTVTTAVNGHPIYWRLKRALDGMRKAPQLFNQFLHSVLTELGMRN